jgi:putative transposase
MNYPQVGIRQLEELLGFTRQGYYQYWQRQKDESDDEIQIVNLIRQFREVHPRIGGRKLYWLLKGELNQREIKMGRDAFFTLLSQHGLLIRRRRRRVITTISRHRFRKYTNLIKELVIERANQVWVCDITYWFTNYSCLYIALVSDADLRRCLHRVRVQERLWVTQ